MTFAYRRDGRQSIDLWCSERDMTPPEGYTPCSAATFRRAWLLRDMLAFRRARRLLNPYGGR